MSLTEPPRPAPPLRLLFLGPLRALMRIDAVEIPCPPDGSQDALWSALRERFPQLAANPGTLRLARQDTFLSPLDRLQPGDEIALIPPVSGG